MKEVCRCAAGVMVWQSQIWGWIWLGAWPCWRYMGTDWVKCGGEVLWRSHRLRSHLPHLWLQPGCLVAWQRCACKAEDVEQFAKKIMFCRNTETAMGRQNCGKKAKWSESDGIIWRQSNRQPKPGSWTVRGKTVMPSGQFEYTSGKQSCNSSIWALNTFPVMHLNSGSLVKSE